MATEFSLTINRKFLAGMVTSLCLTSLQQDYWGLEGTIRQYVNHWCPAKYSVPIAIAGLVWAWWACRERERKAFSVEIEIERQPTHTKEGE